ncbi:MAG: hypothetical protein ACR5KV_05360 [Wolbachia sp.]
MKSYSKKLDLTEAELNRVRKESTVLINNIRKLNDVRDQFCIYLSEYKELFAEFNRLQKETRVKTEKFLY